MQCNTATVCACPGRRYVIHCSGEYELYDLERDPYEQVNLLHDTPSVRQESRTYGGQKGSGGPFFSGLWSQAKAAVALEAGAAAEDEAEAAAGAGDDTDAGSMRPMGSNTHSIKAVVRTAVARAWAATAWAAAALGPRPTAPSLDQSDADRRTSARSSGAPVAGDASSAGSVQPAANEEQGARAATCRTGAQGAGRGTGGGSRSCTAGSGGWGGGAAARRRVAREHAAWVARLRGRLDALAAVLAVCQGHTCTEPFKVRCDAGTTN